MYKRQAFVIFGVIQFYKAANAEQVCGTHGIEMCIRDSHGGVAVADVQLVAGVVDGGRDVECVVFAHGG